MSGDGGSEDRPGASLKGECEVRGDQPHADDGAWNVHVDCPSGVRVTVSTHPSDAVATLIDHLRGCVESCHVTCYTLRRPDGTVVALKDGAQDILVGDTLDPDVLLKLSPEPYTDWEIKRHVEHTALIMSPSQEVFLRRGRSGDAESTDGFALPLPSASDEDDEQPPIEGPFARIQFSSYHPPPRRYRLQGHLAYLDISFLWNHETFSVTCDRHGFTVNRSTAKSFDPESQGTTHPTLFGLLCDRSKIFEVKLRALLRSRMTAERWGSRGLSTTRVWASEDDCKGISCGPSRTSSGVVDWNEEWQRLASLPRDTPQQLLVAECREAVLYSRFLEASRRIAMDVVDGKVVPANLMDPAWQSIFLVDGIFVSYAGGWKPDEAEQRAKGSHKNAPKLMKNDLHIITRLRKLRGPPRIHTVAMAAVDYKGKRVICQSIIPGILQMRSDGTQVVKHVFGFDDEKDEMNCCEEFNEALLSLADVLFVRKHPVVVTKTKERREVLTLNVNGVLGADHRMYLLEGGPLSPREPGHPHDPYPFLRFELLERYQRHISEAGKGKLHLNCDLPNASTLFELEHDEKYEEDVAALQAISRYIRDTVVPEVAGELAAGAVTDGDLLTDFLHQRGLSMRHLGILALALRDSPAVSLLEQEMVVRVIKRSVREAMQDQPPDMAASLAALLSSIFSTAPAKPDKKKKGKKKGGAAEKPKREAWRALLAAVEKKFGYKLAQTWLEKDDLLPVLRAVCLRTGIVLRKREYTFSSPSPITPDDFIDMLPIIHSHDLKISHLQELLDKAKKGEAEGGEEAALLHDLDEALQAVAARTNHLLLPCVTQALTACSAAKTHATVGAGHVPEPVG
eukprot:Sspe_Gene.52057::Locus_28858_Transcript_1_5_Confidence_0.333_Length_2625::g.52057::m.52057/K03255/TIF31, CLU1; protein TIF31